MGLYPEALVGAHNTPGQPGLTVRADDSALTGQALGDTLVQARTGNQKEWDVLLQLAENEAKTLYLDGTALVFQTLPDDAHEPPAAHIQYRVAGQHSLMVAPVLDYQEHSKNDYRIEVQSYSTHDQSPHIKVAGNSRSTTVKRLAAPPDTPDAQLQSLATQRAQEYAATEYTLAFRLEGAIPQQRGQPLVIESDYPPAQKYANQRWYPATKKYLFASQNGWSSEFTCTSLPYSAQTSETADQQQAIDDILAASVAASGGSSSATAAPPTAGTTDPTAPNTTGVDGTGGHAWGGGPLPSLGNPTTLPLRALAAAMQLNGSHAYSLRGMAGPAEWDCSGAVCWAFAQVGVHAMEAGVNQDIGPQGEYHYFLNHGAVARANVGQAQAGDILLINEGRIVGGYPDNQEGFSHIAFALGNGQNFGANSAQMGIVASPIAGYRSHYGSPFNVCLDMSHFAP